MYRRVFAPLAIPATAPPAASAAEGVLSAYMFPEGPPPEVTIVQDETAPGVLHHIGRVEEVVEIPVSVHGGGNVNFRAHEVWVKECIVEHDGGGRLVQACPLKFFTQEFDVNPDAKKFGPGGGPGRSRAGGRNPAPRRRGGRLRHGVSPRHVSAATQLRHLTRL